MSPARVMRRVLLTLLVVAGLGGASLGLAVAGGHLKFSNAKPSLKKQSAKPLPIAGLAPGDTAQRLVTFQNTSRRSITKMRFHLGEKPLPKGARVVRAPAGRVTPPGYRWIRTCRTVLRKGKKITRCTTRLVLAPSPLVTDPAGLRVSVESCAKPWVKLATPVPTYRCAKSRKVLLSSAKVPVARPLRRLPRLRPKARLYLRMTITLPVTAGNTLQHRAATLIPTFTVTGTGR